VACPIASAELSAIHTFIPLAHFRVGEDFEFGVPTIDVLQGRDFQRRTSYELRVVQGGMEPE
jgi:hypothetical protein